MVQSYKRKNSGLNNALSGLERGLGQGIALGQNARAQAESEKNSAFERQQILRRAQIADAELQREEQARQVGGEAMQELAAPETPLKFGGGMLTAPGIAAAQASVAMDDTAKRVGAIAKKMAESGVPMREVLGFLELSKQKHIEADDKARRKLLVDQITNAVKDDTLFGTQADGTRISNPETEKAAQRLLELAGDPNVPLESLRAGLIGLKRGVSQDRIRLAHRQSQVMALDEDIANATAQTAAIQSAPPAFRLALTKQVQRLQTLRHQFDVFYDEITGAKGGGMAFAKQWDDAKNGIAFRLEDGEPVTFAEADKVREYEKKLKDANLRLKQADLAVKEATAERTRAQTGVVPVEAESKRMQAEAELNRSRKTPPEKDPMDYADARKQAIAELLNTDAYDDAEDDEKQKMLSDRTAKIMDDARTATSQAVMDRSVLGNRPGAPDRETFARENLDSFTSEEELRAWLNEGKRPKWMK